MPGETSPYMTGQPLPPLGRIADRPFSGIENRAGAWAGARFSPLAPRVCLTKLALELSVALLASFWVLLGPLSASLRVLLAALRSLLGFSWPPFGSSWGPLRLRLGALRCSKTTFRQHSHLERRFLKNANIMIGILLLSMPDGWDWELKIVLAKVHKVSNDHFEDV